MRTAKARKPAKFKYVAHVVVETDVKLTRKAVKESLSDFCDGPLWIGARVRGTKINLRVRSVDID